MTNIKKKGKVIVLGGGLAGLAASYELSKTGRKVIVFEKYEDVGGLARTIEKNGFKFDTGPHRWYTKNNSVNKWMLDLLRKKVIKVPRLTRIYFDKRFFYYPIKLKNALLGIGLKNSILAVVDYLIARLRSRLLNPHLITMEDGYINQFGKTLYEIFFKRYSEKLWGTDCRNISIDWVGQRTRGLNIFTIIKDTFVKSKNVVSLVDEFSYPETGIGELAQTLSKKTKKNGGEVLINSEVISIHHHNKKIVSVSIKNKNKVLSISGDEFVSSIPLDDFIARLIPYLPGPILEAADKLKYRDELQVAIFVKKQKITPDTWIYVHPKSIPYMRVMEMDNWSQKLSPKGTTTLVFELACNEGDSLWRMKDRDVVKFVADSFINEFQLITSKDIISGYVHRVPKEYPVYHLDYKSDVKKIMDYLKKFQNLQMIGRNGTFRYNNMDHSVEMGLYAAWNIISDSRTYNVDSVNIEREYLEEKKIENIEDTPLDEK